MKVGPTQESRATFGMILVEKHLILNENGCCAHIEVYNPSAFIIYKINRLKGIMPQTRKYFIQITFPKCCAHH